jgi:uncharacterized iron-regulated membrane protein
MPRLARGQLNQRLRKAVFWLHLGAGITAGAVILVMAVTGTLLTYERQMTEWADRGYRSVPPAPGAVRLTAEDILRRAGSGTPTSLTLQSDPAAPAAVGFGREKTVYVNPYTGQALGEGSARVRAFFRGVTDWHRWLAMSGERRDLGKAVTGACNLAFLLLVVSGLYLWLPRQWTRRQVRSVAWFRGGLRGKARDFNWHNVIGLWMWTPLFFIVLTGVVMSYPWANGLLYRLAGEEPPKRSGEERPQRGQDAKPEAPEAVNLEGLDELWAVAEGQVADWQSITLRLPDSPEAPVSFTIARGQRGRADLRAQLTLDRATAETVRWEPYESQGPGRRLRTWSRWVHTGEAGGGAGQTLAGLASAGAAVLVWTGIALAWRRLLAFQLRRKNILRPASPAVSIPIDIPIEDRGEPS